MASRKRVIRLYLSSVIPILTNVKIRHLEMTRRFPMALTETQTRILNNLENHIPALEKGKHPPADRILLGDILNSVQAAASALDEITEDDAVAAAEDDAVVAAEADAGSTAAADASSTVAADAAVTAEPDADETYGAEEADLINDIKAKYNAAVTLVNELKS